MTTQTVKAENRPISENKQPKALLHVLLILGSIVMLLPFFWMVSTSLKTESEIITA